MSLTDHLNRHANAIRWISIAVTVLAAAIAIGHLPLDRGIDLLERTVSDLGFWGPLAFSAAFMVAALAFAPATLLTLTAGAVFGILAGAAIVSISATATAAVAFLIARYLARRKVEQVAARYPKFEAIDRAIAEGGWRVVGLVRLSPGIPFGISNYLFGVTRLRFWPYTLASFVSMLPFVVMYVYLGYAGRASAQAVSGGGGHPWWHWAALGVGLAASVALTIYLTRLARRALKEVTRREIAPGAIERAPARRRLPIDALAAALLALITVVAAAWLSFTRGFLII